MKKTKRLYSFFLLVLTFTPIIGCGSEQTNSTLLDAEVTKVVDGDTLHVMISGKKETIRLLLVDTPETVHPTKQVQPFGPEASNYMKEKLNGEEIQVELGIGERDKYGRLLAYVYHDNQMLNKLLLEKGLARVAYVFEPNTKYIDEFNEIQKQAQNEQVGIWSLENYATVNGFQDETQVENDDTVNSGCTIKGNINSKGEKIYHTMQSPSYNVTKPEVLFCTEKEAVEAGYRPVKR
ncbi:thermonuclease family protein [Metabacillus halosaccharovorans]|uniref:Thermonuclease family protein n=1 Tax=Metabacillus halosaccharovorans TaxID=930124 RepID=A0ABT3DK25_9BACI|nr:thermonuclease family protein [Metabacillus halosaccharovorans]MCV9887404.1 thermonuclease family protein [Metabacillus halosaccharovorans]